MNFHAVTWVLPPVAVRRLGIRDPPHVLGRPGWPGPPAGNWDTIPLTQLSSENPLSFPKTGGLEAQSDFQEGADQPGGPLEGSRARRVQIYTVHHLA